MSTSEKASTDRTCDTSQPSVDGPDFANPPITPEPANDRTGTSGGSAVSEPGLFTGPRASRPSPGKSTRKPCLARGTGPRPKGIAFSIGELLLVQAWAEANDVAMRIFLDHGSRAEEYEEAIAIQPDAGPVGRNLIWRNENFVYVQPLLGRRRRYAMVAAALDSLLPEGPVSVTDIVAKSWPKD